MKETSEPVVASSDPTGLSDVEAAIRLANDGPNVLPAIKAVPAWRQLAAQLVSFFAVMLWFAGVLAVLGGLPQLGVAVFAVVIINGVFAFIQEYRAERAADSLRDLLPQIVTVIRDGEQRLIQAADLVVGDRVVLLEGDRISADMTCVESHGLSLDLSTMTGESVPESLGVDGRLWAGSFVTEGEGIAVVIATGGTTRLASIAALTQGTARHDTPLTKELHRLVRTIAVIAVGTGTGFFLLSLALSAPPSEGFVFAIGVTVALVPEGLLPTITLSLAIGAQRMAERHALVRRLESVETLGSTTFICTDKTGTLTQNRMNVVEVWTPTGTVRIDGVGYEPRATLSADSSESIDAASHAADVARTCSRGRAVEEDGRWVPRGDPMEAAIDALALRLGVPRARSAGVDRRFPFDPGRRRASIVTEGRVLVKGAPDAVFERCRSLQGGVSEVLSDLSSRGLRVLAVAERVLEVDVPDDADHAERDLDLLALLAFQDPPRPEAQGALAACRTAGIRVAMITGDDPRTARAIADQVGLRRGDSPVLTGVDLPADEQLLGAMVDRDGVVVARVSPEDKLRIAKSLRARGHVLAMTGDGVNDGPALREADIGIAMGESGSDVAREAADLVLLDDNFATIVAAISQGRATFANARRFLTYHLADNVAELTPFLVWAMSGDRFPLALGVLQILALDIGTDTLSAAALGAEPANPQVMSGPPSSGRLLDRTVAIRSFAVAGPVEALFEMSAFLVALVAAGWRVGAPFPTGAPLAAASGAAFATVVVGQTANAFACRSTMWPAWRLGLRGNRFLAVAASVELLFAVTCLALGPMARLLEHQWPPLSAWLVIVLSAPAVIVADSIWKRRHRAEVARSGPGSDDSVQ